MPGADANTGWLGGCVPLDGQRFVKTGVDLQPEVELVHEVLTE
jgi:hypothetical protein